MNVEVTIVYDTSRDPKARDAYKVSYATTDRLQQPLKRIGPVSNRLTYRGVYPSRAKAEQAADTYMKGL